MSTRRLIVSGFPCPQESWNRLFADKTEQRILPLAEAIEKSNVGDPRKWAKLVTAEIASFKPTSIVCHDVGVTLTLLALLSLQRKDKLDSKPRVTIFNGAFRGFNVLKAPHPFLVQLNSFSAIRSKVQEIGGDVDLRFEKLMPLVKRFYLYVIAHSLRELVSTRIFKKVPNKISLILPMQLIASENDPYIPKEAMDALENDFSIKTVHRINYGHFPYSLKNGNILQLVQQFEASA